MKTLDRSKKSVMLCKIWVLAAVSWAVAGDRL